MDSMMRWSEVTQQQKQVGGGGVGGGGSDNNNGGSSNGVASAPTIKNHSVTHFNGYLFCFGGYDGRRNHMTLLLYSIAEQRWIRPTHVASTNGTTTTTNTNSANSTSINNNLNLNNGGLPSAVGMAGAGVGVHPSNLASFHNSNGGQNISSPNDGGLLYLQQQQQQQQMQMPGLSNLAGGVVNHSNPYYSVVAGGAGVGVGGNPPHHLLHRHDSGSSLGGGGSNNNMNMNNIHMDPTTIFVSGTPPPGRNGHSATLAAEDEENGRIIIIGGWLGTGPLAASDMHVLDVSAGGRQLQWYQPAIKGTPPGPCNMHSADYVAARKEVYTFRGGNGREYLNDLHALHVETLTWRAVETTGAIPQQRANHSSAILEETQELFIFGGWNGTERLNDIHILDTTTSTWTCPHVGGVLPHPRAGMTLTALRGRLYLFGGSGTSAKCFQDLQILDRQEMAWLDVTTQYESGSSVGSSVNGAGVVGGAYHLHHNNNSNNHHHRHVVLRHDVDDNDVMDDRFHFGGGPVGNGPLYGGDDSYGVNRFGGYGDVVGDHRHDSSNDTTGVGGGGGSRGRMGFTSSRADWRSRDMAVRPRQSGTVNASPNPNDEDSVPTVVVHGRGPGRRAGHTATAVHRKIYIFGGSCGSDYLNDFFVLDTDPPPHAMVTEPTSLQLLERRLGHFFNDEEFSDVAFVVQGQKVYAHKMVLSIVSEFFRAMFTAGFRESAKAAAGDENRSSKTIEIEIPDCSYESFLAVMEYIYTGGANLPKLDLTTGNNNNNNNNNNGASHSNNNSVGSFRLGGNGQAADEDPAGGGVVVVAFVLGDARVARIVEMLELADRFFLDHLKQVCEHLLQPAVHAETVDYLLAVAQKTNANQLQSICEHYIRNREGNGVGNGMLAAHLAGNTG